MKVFSWAKSIFYVLCCLYSFTFPAHANPPSQACADCHQEQVKDWQTSDHFHAMEKANLKTSLGQFDNRQINYLGKAAKFYQDQSDKLWVDFTDEKGQQQHLNIQYTFGYKPLQQYLFDAGNGRWQFIPFAWDSRDKKDGGQRWFVLHPEQKPTDTFHWTQAGQNWNQMCADCHTTDFKKNFNPKNKQYNSTYSAQNVSCNACHGDESKHLRWANGDKEIKDKGYPSFIGKKAPLFQKDQQGNMQPIGKLKSSNQVNTCASCHARRAQLADRKSPQALLNAFDPSLIDSNLYYPDGQILDEDYVWGSFMQSKMHQKGVTCTNCHNPHSGKIKLPGNQVCTQCHGATYDSNQHHHHDKMKQGNQCVDCHMPATTYMQVDPRRDHSFKVPRPDLTLITKAPNACNRCHADKSASWSLDQIKNWYPNSRHIEQAHYATTFYQADQQQLGSARTLAQIAEDPAQTQIIQASALSRMGNLPDTNAINAIAQAVLSNEPLKRLGAIDAAQNIPMTQRWRLLGPLIYDKNLAIRTEAARTLAPILIAPPLTSGLDEKSRKQLNHALDEYRQAQAYQADRGFSYVALANLELSLQHIDKAIDYFHQAIKIEPNFVPAYVNLADIYRQQKNETKAQQVLKNGLKQAPDIAALNYAYAMSLVRSQNKPKARDALEKASQLAPQNGQYQYAYALLLQDLGENDAALQALEKAFALTPDNPDLAYALSQAYMDKKDYVNALKYAKALQSLLPNNSQINELVTKLETKI